MTTASQWTLERAIGEYIRKNVSVRLIVRRNGSKSSQLVVQLWDGPMMFQESAVNVESLRHEGDW